MKYSLPYTRISLIMLVASILVSCGVREGESSSASSSSPLSDSSMNSVPTSSVIQTQAQNANQNADQTPIAVCKLTPDSNSTQTVESAHSLDAVAFSEPQVVFSGNVIGIAEWLPDSQRVLISRVSLKDQAESIDVLDLSNTSSSQLTLHKGGRTTPLWLDSISSVVFVETIGANQSTLKIVRDSGGDTALEVSNLVSPYIAVAPKGNQISYVDTTGLSELITEAEKDPDGVSATYESLTSPSGFINAFTRSVWSSDGQRMLLFNDSGFGSSDVFVLEPSTQSMCSFLWNTETSTETREWLVDAKWSPNGRYIALVTALGQVGRLQYASLKVLDMVTGVVSLIELESQYIYEIDWMPAGTQLLALGSVEHINGFATVGLYLVDIEKNSSARVLPTISFAPGAYGFGGGGLAVAPDGRKVLTICPDWKNIASGNGVGDDQICLINISSK